MNSNARAYDELSTTQIDAGSQFIQELSLSPGDKVLDMGCGTGNLTKYIADIVGPDGLVVGIDPDAERIKIAQEKFKEVSNLQFHVGSSVTGFPHDNESYYDVHISMHAFHWVPHKEKIVYIQKAHRCLKPGRKLAIMCGEKILGVKKDIFAPHLLTHDGYLKLFQEVGLFVNVDIEKDIYQARFTSLELFKQWYKASIHQDFDSLDPTDVQEYIIVEDDGSVTCKIPRICIMASTNI